MTTTPEYMALLFNDLQRDRQDRARAYRLARQTRRPRRPARLRDRIRFGMFPRTGTSGQVVTQR